MINRIVKMTFREDEVDNFLKIFDSSKEKIRSFPGVRHLELLQHSHQKNILFTYSLWESEEDLEEYRHSTLFKDTWAKTKPLFSAKAEAWSTISLHRLA
jgi:heme-degrading monooxygenase HmoA